MSCAVAVVAVVVVVRRVFGVDKQVYTTRLYLSLNSHEIRLFILFVRPTFIMHKYVLYVLCSLKLPVAEEAERSCFGRAGKTRRIHDITAFYFPSAPIS